MTHPRSTAEFECQASRGLGHVLCFVFFLYWPNKLNTLQPSTLSPLTQNLKNIYVLVKQNKIRRKGTFSQTSKISSTVHTWAFLVHWEETIAVVQSCDYFVPLGEQLAQKSRGMCPGRSDSYTVSQSKPWALNINDGMMILSLSCLGCLWLNQNSIN